MSLEMQLYDALLLALQDYIVPIQRNAQALARLDCLLCFAHNAVQFKYRRPEVTGVLSISISKKAATL